MKNRIKSYLAFILIFLMMLPSGGFSVLAADASADLAGIAIGNLSIADFDPAVTEYDFAVPYTYIANDFTTVATPEVKAYAADSNATVTVTQPQTADGGAAIITVANGENTKTYTVNLTTAAMNLDKDGGFEDSSTYSWYRWTKGLVCSFTDSYPHEGAKALNYSSTVWDTVSVYANDGEIAKANTTYLVTYFARDVNNSGVSWYASNKGTYSSKKYYNEDGSERSSDYLGMLSSEYSRVIQTYVLEADTAATSLGYGPITMSVAHPIEIDEKYFAPLTVTDIAYSGVKTVEIPASDSTSIAVAGKGKLLNQIGGTHGLENETISYRMISAPEGVTFDGTNLTVASTAAEGLALVEMSSTLSFSNGIQTKVASIEEISIVPDRSAEVAELLDIQVGKLSIPGFDPKTSAYNMIVPYSYEPNNFEAPSVPEIKVYPRNPEADITIAYPETLDDGTATITVVSGEYSKTYTVNLSAYAVNEATDGGMETGEWHQLNVNSLGAAKGGLTSEVKKAGNTSFKFYLTGPGNVLKNPDDGLQMNPGVKYLLRYDVMAADEDMTVYASEKYANTDRVRADYYPDGTSKVGDSLKITTTEWLQNTQVWSSAGGNTDPVRFSPSGVANKNMYLDEYYYAPLTATDIVLTGTSCTEVPASSASFSLNAKLLNQIGGTHGLEGETVSYELLGDYEGVSLSGSTLTITSDAAVGSVPIRVKSSFSNGAQTGVWDIVEFDIVDTFSDSALTLAGGAETGTVTASILAKNDGMALTMYLALYEEADGSHYLKAVDYIDACGATDGVIKAKLSLDIPQDGKTYSAKCFLWDDSLKPVVVSKSVQ